MRFALTLTAFVGSVAALSITSPKKDQDVDLTEKTTVEWSSVRYFTCILSSYVAY
jgi:hypothetical protein